MRPYASHVEEPKRDGGEILRTIDDQEFRDFIEREKVKGVSGW